PTASVPDHAVSILVGNSVSKFTAPRTEAIVDEAVNLPTRRACAVRHSPSRVQHLDSRLTRSTHADVDPGMALRVGDNECRVVVLIREANALDALRRTHSPRRIRPAIENLESGAPSLSVGIFK